MVDESYKYGKPLTKIPRGRKRLPQYDECIREFLASKSNYWEVNLDSLPSHSIMIVLSSLRWRVKNNPSEYGNVRVIMRDKKIFLEKVKN
jgi:hypothetical protein